MVYLCAFHSSLPICILLMLGGMDFFEAINHAFSTMATGGFSTKNDSIAAFSPYIHYVIILFMIIAGTNFSLHYYLYLKEISPK
jgi:trk system potassium uptake protein